MSWKDGFQFHGLKFSIIANGWDFKPLILILLPKSELITETWSQAAAVCFSRIAFALAVEHSPHRRQNWSGNFWSSKSEVHAIHKWWEAVSAWLGVIGHTTTQTDRFLREVLRWTSEAFVWPDPSDSQSLSFSLSSSSYSLYVREMKKPRNGSINTKFCGNSENRKSFFELSLSLIFSLWCLVFLFYSKRGLSHGNGGKWNPMHFFWVFIFFSAILFFGFRICVCSIFILFYFSGFGADLLSFVGVFVFPLHTPTLFFCWADPSRFCGFFLVLFLAHFSVWIFWKPIFPLLRVVFFLLIFLVFFLWQNHFSLLRVQFSWEMNIR